MTTAMPTTATMITITDHDVGPGRGISAYPPETRVETHELCAKIAAASAASGDRPS